MRLCVYPYVGKPLKRERLTTSLLVPLPSYLERWNVIVASLTPLGFDRARQTNGDHMRNPREDTSLHLVRYRFGFPVFIYRNEGSAVILCRYRALHGPGKSSSCLCWCLFCVVSVQDGATADPPLHFQVLFNVNNIPHWCTLAVDYNINENIAAMTETWNLLKTAEKDRKSLSAGISASNHELFGTVCRRVVRLGKDSSTSRVLCSIAAYNIRFLLDCKDGYLKTGIYKSTRYRWENEPYADNHFLDGAITHTTAAGLLSQLE